MIERVLAGVPIREAALPQAFVLVAPGRVGEPQGPAPHDRWADETTPPRPGWATRARIDLSPRYLPHPCSLVESEVVHALAYDFRISSSYC